MKKLATFGILALLLLSIVASSAYAFSNEKDQEGINNKYVQANREEHRKQGMQFREDREQGRKEHKEMITNACQEGELPENLEGPRVEFLEENFDAICQIHEAKENGASKEEIKTLADELGLDRPGKGMRGHGRGLFRNNFE